mgnify:CR=1 FL=1
MTSNNFNIRLPKGGLFYLLIFRFFTSKVMRRLGSSNTFVTIATSNVIEVRMPSMEVPPNDEG